MEGFVEKLCNRFNGVTDGGDDEASDPSSGPCLNDAIESNAHKAKAPQLPMSQIKGHQINEEMLDGCKYYTDYEDEEDNDEDKVSEND
ncbi:Glycogen synthase [Bienertia sinuspersici]